MDSYYKSLPSTELATLAAMRLRYSFTPKPGYDFAPVHGVAQFGRVFRNRFNRSNSNLRSQNALVTRTRRLRSAHSLPILPDMESSRFTSTGQVRVPKEKSARPLPEAGSRILQAPSSSFPTAPHCG